MKILLAVNGSACSGAALRMVTKRPWPAGSELRVISVAEKPVMTAGGSCGNTLELASPTLLSRVEQIILENARAAVNMALRELEGGNQSGLEITTKIVKGSPARSILDEAEGWDADLIVVGSCGDRDWRSVFRSDAAMAVAKHGKCSVEIVKLVKTSNEECWPDGLVEREVCDVTC